MSAKSNSTMKYGKTRSSELYVAAIFKMIAERAIFHMEIVTNDDDLSSFYEG